MKVLKIGVLGSVNGLRIRSWFRQEYDELRDLCERTGVPYYSVSGLNSVEMECLLKRLDVDVGLSLGNGFIAERIFSIPRRGFINVHSEILPQYQNAQSIIWPIYRMDPYTGFTIHEVARKIDAGRILYQEKIPLSFCPRLEDTVRHNRMEVERRIPKALVYVCKSIDRLQSAAVEQGAGGHYTTPSIWQFIRMIYNNRRLYTRQKRGAGLC